MVDLDRGRFIGMEDFSKIGGRPERILPAALIGGIGLGLLIAGALLFIESAGCVVCSAGKIAIVALITGGIVAPAALVRIIGILRDNGS